MSKYPDNTSESLRRNIYIDNLAVTFESEEELVKFYHRAKQIMSEGGFNLREWVTNSVLLKSLNEDSVCSNTVAKVLGITWDTITDTITMCPYATGINESTTKREVVSSIAKTFDPYGILLPVTVQGKLLLQDLWKNKIGWDDPVPKDLLVKWRLYISDLNNLSFVTKRSFNTFKKPELHVFADASKRCYGAVAYLVEGSSKISLCLNPGWLQLNLHLCPS